MINQKTINPHALYYQCSKDGPDFLFEKLIIRDSRDEPCLTAKKHHYRVKSKLIHCLRIILKSK